MLIIISDLHLTDGTSGDTIKAGAFKAFRERVRDLCYDASWRQNGEYQPIEEFDLLLLGDILDVIRSTKWLDDSVRPWDDSKKPGLLNKVREITTSVLKKNKESLDCLKSLQDPKVITVPADPDDDKSRSGARDPEANGRMPVRGRIHYMVGNHDWFFHLPGTAANSLRKRVAGAIGLANPSNKPFPHEAEESNEIMQVLVDHGVYARHGDIYDAFNYEGNRDASSLGDVIVVELLNRFPAEVAKRFGAELPAEVLSGLREIDNVRPLLVIPAWIDGLLERTCPDPQQRKNVKKTWDELADEFLKLPFVRSRDKWYQVNDLVDKLEWGLKFSRGVSLNRLGKLLEWWSEFTGGGRSDFFKHAFTERAYRNRTAKHIVYGHTHAQELVPLDSSFTQSGLLNQRYINTGTWRRVHELSTWRPEEQEFMGHYVMTYAAFFKDGERGGRSFETWTGALGE